MVMPMKKQPLQNRKVLIALKHYRKYRKIFKQRETPELCCSIVAPCHRKKTFSDAEMPARIFVFTNKDGGGIASQFVQLNSIRAVESMTKLLRQLYSKLLRDLGWFKDFMWV
ncbi:hypothetical protein D8674_003806 [Pyrus ussuriensis x Pyrus communis]|uniref:Uncharacterized protein n=1 Tax=Pyrus ussuriensis x Pyrus communis TaxID=2448454 RepID=A0A5N5FMB3_9ROSA|nr:hypothetical protein D8674_003806 [Pyrus ussuriensis x Pyrus communis]